MGRYSSVQAFADNHSSVRSISYEQATGVSQSSSANNNSSGSGENNNVSRGPVETEKVSNPYGSTAGAGSGEFHVYRHARAREMTRWRELDAKEKEEEKQKKFDDRVKQEQQKEEEKTAKRRQKRQKAKQAKLRKKTLMAAGIQILKASQPNNNLKNADDDEEFTYTPMAQLKQEGKEVDDSKKPAEIKSQDETNNSGQANTELSGDIPTDGSFLEVMKKRLLAESNKSNDKNVDDEEGPLLSVSSSKRPKLENGASAGADTSDAPQPPRAMMVSETKIIDEDDEEGPPLPPSMRS